MLAKMQAWNLFLYKFFFPFFKGDIRNVPHHAHAVSVTMVVDLQLVCNMCKCLWTDPSSVK